MDNKLRSALDKVRAEDELVERTVSRLAQEMHRSQYRRTGGYRFAAACAALLIVLSLGGLSLNLYFTPSGYIDVDVNPSIELTLNRLGRVIQGSAYNEDGERILSEVSVRHLDYGAALDRLINAMAMDDYLRQDGLVSVTVQSGDSDALLPNVQVSLDQALSAHQLSAQTEVSAVSLETKEAANGHHLSPAKYIAITQLQLLDPAVTIDGCRDHSISELRQSAHDHADSHEASGTIIDETTLPSTVLNDDDEHEAISPSPVPKPTSGGRNKADDIHHGDGHH